VHDLDEGVGRAFGKLFVVQQPHHRLRKMLESINGYKAIFKKGLGSAWSRGSEFEKKGKEK
jgi:hypothetical protein